MRTFLLLSLLALPCGASACINSVGTDREGRQFLPVEYTGKELRDSLLSQNGRKYWLGETHKVIDKAKKIPDFESLTNLAVATIYQGRYPEAIRLLLAIEKRYPGRNETAANLGTALELSGHDHAALKWIRIGIVRDRKEHFGTEWLHARILESKIEAARQPGYLNGRSVADVEFNDVLVPSMPTQMPLGNSGKPVQPYELDRALRYQLSERLQFVRPKDAVVASLLMDWATLNLVGGPVENVEVLYDMAVDYGAAQTDLMKARRNKARSILANAKESEKFDGRCQICMPPPPPPPLPPRA